MSAAGPLPPLNGLCDAGAVRLPRILAMAIATLVAPAAAAPAAVFVLTATAGGSIGALLLSPLIAITLPGMYAYGIALPVVLVLSLPLTAAAHAMPAFRRKRVWGAIGAAFGLPVAWALGGPGGKALLAGAAAGAACALTYRLIVGRSFEAPQVEFPEARL